MTWKFSTSVPFLTKSLPFIWKLSAVLVWIPLEVGLEKRILVQVIYVEVKVIVAEEWEDEIEREEKE